jgi:hypothetical protein
MCCQQAFEILGMTDLLSPLQAADVTDDVLLQVL